MRIAIICHCRFPWNRGIGRLARTLHEQGHQVHILTKTTSKGTDYPYATIHAFPFALLKSHMPFNFLWALWIIRVCLRQKIDLLIVRELPLALQSYLAAKIMRKPILMDMREHYPAAGKAWGKKRADLPGLTITDMIPAMLEGKLKGLYVIGENPKLSDPDWNHLNHALKELDFLVVQELFLSETAQVADVVFSAASVAEKEGTITNTERR